MLDRETRDQNIIVDFLFQFLTCKRRLPKPHDCPEDMYEIMQEGWNERPEKRFSPQMIFSKLIMARKFVTIIF